MFKLKQVSIALGLVLANYSTVCLGVNFTQADELFKKRGESFEEATKARQAYHKMIVSENLNEEEKIYAVTQMSRLDLYRGAMIDGVDNSKRKDLLEACIDNVDQIQDTKSQEFYYFKMSCIAFRGKLSGFMGRVKYGLMLRSVQDKALESTKDEQGKLQAGFEGGGVLRVLSAIRGNRKAKPLGLYNPNEALQFIQVALQAPARQVSPFPEPLAGSDYYENSYYLGQSHVALGIENNDKAEVNKGKKILVETVEELDMLEENDLLPAGRKPETNFYKKLMNEMISSVTTCAKDTDSWKSCLSKELD